MPIAVDQAFLPQKLGILGMLGINGRGYILSPFWAGLFETTLRKAGCSLLHMQ